MARVAPATRVSRASRISWIPRVSDVPQVSETLVDDHLIVKFTDILALELVGVRSA